MATILSTLIAPGVPVAKDPGYLGAHLTNIPPGVLWHEVCTQPEVADKPWCDTTLSDKERAAAYVAVLRVKEKVALLDNEAEGIERLHIPPHQWASEGLHGAAQSSVCSPTEPDKCATPTSFPAPSALGASFNRTLFWSVGHITGVEARAISNLRTNHDNFYGDGLSYWSPTINLAMDPRWGRNMEVPGEDPTLTGQYAASFVRGLQGASQRGNGEPPNGRHTVLGCCKHFLANNLESWGGYTRHNFDAQVSLADLADYHLPPFEACIKEGRSKAVMCSYNRLNGVPMCANERLLNQTLRRDWQFDGYVVADCDAVGDIYTALPEGHGLTADPAQGVATALKAGTDVDCGYWGKRAYYNELPKALERGLVTEGHLDASVTRLAELQMQLGLFDPKPTQPLAQLGIESIHTAAHRKLARDAARQSIVLLKNDALTLIPSDGEVLPLSSGMKLAVIGPHHDAREVLLSNYHGQACPTWGGDLSCIPSPLEAIKEANAEGVTLAALGCDVHASSAETRRLRLDQLVAESVQLQAVAAQEVYAQAVKAQGVDAMPPKAPPAQSALAQAVAEAQVKARNGSLEIPLPIHTAVTAAQAADRVVLIVGLDMKAEGEGQDRTHTRLPGEQEELIRRVLATGTPTVLVLMRGGSVSLGEDIINSAGAIVDAGYGGEQAAAALSDVLFGDYNPSGRLPMTAYKSDYVGQLPLTEMSMSKPPGRTYMYYTGTPEWRFGHGLSYDAWELAWAPDARDLRLASINEESHAFFDWMLSQNSDDAAATLASTAAELARVSGAVRKRMGTEEGAELTYAISVSNKGAHGGSGMPGRGGSVTVLGFWEPVGELQQAFGPLQRRLFAFDGASVGAGDAKQLQLKLTSDALAVANERGERIVHPGVYRLVFEGPDATASHVMLNTTVAVEGSPRVVSAMPM